ncbi:MAG: GNAT family N-acetyltransferase [Thermoleophilaceae bacterium]
MRRALPGGYELDDDRGRLDLNAIHAYLSGESYWAKGRSREDTEAAIRNSTRVIGVYAGDRQVGFARVVSDGVTFAYLADVYVLDEARGHGLGVELVREAVEHGPETDARWILGTVDAQGLYERFGFGPASERIMERLPRREQL